ncbi:MAG: hypothetical protein IK011_04085, partial [Bacteroidaceae bacterium]|nr:hypothetical protein [Bacteroidaceae bacterium]
EPPLAVFLVPHGPHLAVVEKAYRLLAHPFLFDWLSGFLCAKVVKIPGSSKKSERFFSQQVNWSTGQQVNGHLRSTSQQVNKSTGQLVNG